MLTTRLLRVVKCFIEKVEDIPVRLGHGTVPDLFFRQIGEI